MTTKERIQAEIEHVSDERDLNELYKIVKDFTESKRNSGQSLMSKLRSISIDAPEDFSAELRSLRDRRETCRIGSSLTLCS